MQPDKRRQQILVMLQNSLVPLTGAELARSLNVSRQVIVQDIALLRASGNDIIATPQGYLLTGKGEERVSQTFACRHNPDQIEEELCIIIDNGGRVLDVIVEHPVYGQLTGLLMLSSRLDLAKFLEKLRSSKAEPLSVLTQGIHLHTVEAPDKEHLEIIAGELARAGFLVSAD